MNGSEQGEHGREAKGNGEMKLEVRDTGPNTSVHQTKKVFLKTQRTVSHKLFKSSDVGMSGLNDISSRSIPGLNAIPLPPPFFSGHCSGVLHASIQQEPLSDAGGAGGHLPGVPRQDRAHLHPRLRDPQALLGILQRRGHGVCSHADSQRHNGGEHLLPSPPTDLPSLLSCPSFVLPSFPSFVLSFFTLSVLSFFKSFVLLRRPRLSLSMRLLKLGQGTSESRAVRFGMPAMLFTHEH